MHTSRVKVVAMNPRNTNQPLLPRRLIQHYLERFRIAMNASRITRIFCSPVATPIHRTYDAAAHKADRIQNVTNQNKYA
jgi:hypothetical protein